MEQRISFWHRLLNLIAPQGCAVCGCRLGMSEEVICSTCNLHLPRTGFASHAYDNDMARRFWARIPVERASALFYYEAGSEVSRIIHRLKYSDHPEIGVSMGKMAAEEFAVHGFFEGIDLIVPVPLERKRQRQRGYNQSVEIAKGVSEATGIPIETRAVKRTLFHGSQTQKNQQQRMENVENAFHATGEVDLTGKHILMIDDIVTSGATICACAGVFSGTPGLRISVLSLGMAK